MGSEHKVLPLAKKLLARKISFLQWSVIVGIIHTPEPYAQEWLAHTKEPLFLFN